MADRRTSWEERWRGSGASFAWYAEAAPEHLTRLLDAGGVTGGAALDLGCGEGAAAREMSRVLTPSVGVDVAMTAIRRARERARDAGSPAAFLVAAAPVLPFRDATFALVFDRGCLHNIERPLWPAYFREVDRLLSPGGMFQLFVLGGAMPPVLSRRGMRARLRHPREIFRSKRDRARLFEQRLRSQLPPSFEVVETSEVPFERGGRRRTFLHLLARKTAPAEGRNASRAI